MRISIQIGNVSLNVDDLLLTEDGVGSIKRVEQFVDLMTKKIEDLAQRAKDRGIV